MAAGGSAFSFPAGAHQGRPPPKELPPESSQVPLSHCFLQLSEMGASESLFESVVNSPCFQRHVSTYDALGRVHKADAQGMPTVEFVPKSAAASAGARVGRTGAAGARTATMGELRRGVSDFVSACRVSREPELKLLFSNEFIGSKAATVSSGSLYASHITQVGAAGDLTTLFALSHYFGHTIFVMLGGSIWCGNARSGAGSQEHAAPSLVAIYPEGSPRQLHGTRAETDVWGDFLAYLEGESERQSVVLAYDGAFFATVHGGRPVTTQEGRTENGCEGALAGTTRPFPTPWRECLAKRPPGHLAQSLQAPRPASGRASRNRHAECPRYCPPSLRTPPRTSPAAAEEQGGVQPLGPKQRSPQQNGMVSGKPGSEGTASIDPRAQGLRQYGDQPDAPFITRGVHDETVVAAALGACTQEDPGMTGLNRQGAAESPADDSGSPMDASMDEVPPPAALESAAGRGFHPRRDVEVVTPHVSPRHSTSTDTAGPMVVSPVSPPTFPHTPPSPTRHPDSRWSREEENRQRQLERWGMRSSLAPDMLVMDSPTRSPARRRRGLLTGPPRPHAGTPPRPSRPALDTPEGLRGPARPRGRPQSDTLALRGRKGSADARRQHSPVAAATLRAPAVRRPRATHTPPTRPSGGMLTPLGSPLQPKGKRPCLARAGTPHQPRGAFQAPTPSRLHEGEPGRGGARSVVDLARAGANGQGHSSCPAPGARAKHTAQPATEAEATRALLDVQHWPRLPSRQDPLGGARPPAGVVSPAAIPVDRQERAHPAEDTRALTPTRTQPPVTGPPGKRRAHPPLGLLRELEAVRATALKPTTGSVFDRLGAAPRLCLREHAPEFLDAETPDQPAAVDQAATGAPTHPLQPHPRATPAARSLEATPCILARECGCMDIPARKAGTGDAYTCPFRACGVLYRRAQELADHMNAKHSDVRLGEACYRRAGTARCRACGKVLISLVDHDRTCTRGRDSDRGPAGAPPVGPTHRLEGSRMVVTIDLARLAQQLKSQAPTPHPPPPPPKQLPPLPSQHPQQSHLPPPSTAPPPVSPAKGHIPSPAPLRPPVGPDAATGDTNQANTPTGAPTACANSRCACHQRARAGRDPKGPYMCLVAGCTEQFTRAGPFAHHVRTAHAQEALTAECVHRVGLFKCPRCDRILGSRVNHAKHCTPGPLRRAQSLPDVRAGAVDDTNTPAGAVPGVETTKGEDPEAPHVQPHAQQQGHPDHQFHGHPNPPPGMEPRQVAPHMDLAVALQASARAVMRIPWSFVMGTEVATSPFVPQGAAFRQHLAGVFSAVFQQAAGQEATEADIKFLCFLPKLLFGRTPSRAWSKKEQIRRRLDLVMWGRVEESEIFLWAARAAEQADPPPPPHKRDLSEDAARMAAAKRATRLVQTAELGRAVKALTSDLTTRTPDQALRKAIQDLHPAGVAPPDAAQPTFAAPAQPPQAPPRPPDPARIVLTTDAVVWAIDHAPRGSAPGLSGLRPEHLMAAAKHPTCPQAAVHITAMLQRIARNDLPRECPRELIYGGVLSPFEKRGTGKLRPITVGDVLVRTAGRAIARLKGVEARNLFPKSGQMGIAVPAGAESIIHATRIALEAHPDWAVLQIDFKNAYNTVSRTLIREELLKHFPDLVDYFDARYGQPTKLFVPALGVGQFIWSEVGVHQGDPLGPLFFALALRAVMVATVTRQDTNAGQLFVDILLILAYLDDLVVIGPPACLARYFARLQAFAATLRSGLEVNVDKTLLFTARLQRESAGGVFCEKYADMCDRLSRHWPDEPFAFADLGRLPIVTGAEHILVLGSPIGAAQALEDFLREELRKTTHLLERLMWLHSTQARLLLLRYCAVPRAAFLIRTMPPSLVASFTVGFDELIIAHFAHTQEFGMALPPGSDAARQWRYMLQAPKRLGGVGLLSSEVLSPMAYLASLADATRCMAEEGNQGQPWALLRHDVHAGLASTGHGDHAFLPEAHTALVHYWAGVEAFRQSFPLHGQAQLADPTKIPHTPLQLPLADPQLQHRLTKLRFQMDDQRFLTSISPALRSWVLSIRAPGGSAPLDAIPTCASLTMSNEVMRHFLIFHQGMHIIHHNPRAFNSCDMHKFDELCPRGDGSKVQHDTVCNVLAQMFAASGHPVVNYSRGRQAEEHRHHDLTPDLLVSDFPNPLEMSYVEFGISSPLGNNVLDRASNTPLVAADTYARQKLTKYDNLAAFHGRHVYAAIMESSGALGKGIQDVMATCASQVPSEWFEETASQRSYASASFKRFFTQRLTIALWSAALQKRRAHSWAHDPAAVRAAQAPRAPERGPSALPNPEQVFADFAAVANARKVNYSSTTSCVKVATLQSAFHALPRSQTAVEHPGAQMRAPGPPSS